MKSFSSVLGDVVGCSPLVPDGSDVADIAVAADFLPRLAETPNFEVFTFADDVQVAVPEGIVVASLDFRERDTTIHAIAPNNVLTKSTETSTQTIECGAEIVCSGCKSKGNETTSVTFNPAENGVGDFSGTLSTARNTESVMTPVTGELVRTGATGIDKQPCVATALAKTLQTSKWYACVDEGFIDLTPFVVPACVPKTDSSFGVEYRRIRLWWQFESVVRRRT